MRKHFNCSTLEGAELEDQGVLGTALTHWEKRVFEVTLTFNTVTIIQIGYNKEIDMKCLPYLEPLVLNKLRLRIRVAGRKVLNYT